MRSPPTGKVVFEAGKVYKRNFVRGEAGEDLTRYRSPADHRVCDKVKSQ